MRPLAMPAILAAGAVTAAASADVIVHDNRDGEFIWVYAYEGDPGASLDVTQPPSQSGASSATGFVRLFEPEIATPHFTQWFLRKDYAFPSSESGVVADDEPTVVIDEKGTPNQFWFVRELAPGDVVDATKNFLGTTLYYIDNFYVNPPVQIAIDTPTFVGVRVDRDGQVHYGWIFVDRIEAPWGFGELVPLAWGHESDPDTPIVIPDLSCAGDVDGDTTVGIEDLLGLLAQWGTDPSGPPDFNGDGNVGIDDLLTLLSAWGPCPF